MTLDDLIAAVEGRRKYIVVYDREDDGDVVREFETRNVVVEHEPIPPGGPPGFVVIRDDGGFVGAIGITELDELLSPPIRKPWDEEFVEAGYRALFDVLDDTLFSSFDRRQLLAAAREIENRAWRVGRGTLRVGFQSLSAMRDQVPVYERLGDDTDLDVYVYGRRDWDPPEIPRVTVRAESNDEIGSHWFLGFDGGERAVDACALVAEERSPGSFYGFWTYDPATVEELLDYLRHTYG